MPVRAIVRVCVCEMERERERVRWMHPEHWLMLNMLLTGPLYAACQTADINTNTDTWAMLWSRPRATQEKLRMERFCSSRGENVLKSKRGSSNSLIPWWCLLFFGGVGSPGVATFSVDHSKWWRQDHKQRTLFLNFMISEVRIVHKYLIFHDFLTFFSIF